MSIRSFFRMTLAGALLMVAAVAVQAQDAAKPNEAPMAPPGVPLDPKPAVEIAPTPAPTLTIGAWMEQEKKFTIMLNLFKAAGMDGLLTGKDPHTVFLVEDGVIKAKFQAEVDNLLKPEQKDALKNLVSYHIAKGALTSGNLKDNETGTVTLNPAKVYYKTEKENDFINDRGVIGENIAATNGTIFVLDGLLHWDYAVVKEIELARLKQQWEAEAAKGTPVPTPVPEYPMDRTIVKELKTLEGLTTLVQAIEAAGLDEELEKESAKYTIFAPVNMAFEALPAGELNRLLKPENQEELLKILEYHVVLEPVVIGNLTGPKSFKTLHGATVTITPESAQVGTATLIDAAETKIKNGVMYFLDGVLMPPPAPKPRGAEASAWDVMEQDGNYKRMLRLFRAAGLEDMLKNDEVTVFVVPDDVRSSLNEAREQALLMGTNAAILKDTMGYHAGRGILGWPQALLNGSVKMENGKTAYVVVEKGAIKINGAQPLVKSHLAKNGVIFVVGDTLSQSHAAGLERERQIKTPMTADEMMKSATVLGELKALESTTLLVSLMTLAGLEERLGGEDAVTVFAPSNAAIEALPAAELNRLLQPENKAEFEAVMKYHVARGLYLVGDMAGPTAIPTLQGEDLLVDRAKEKAGDVDMTEFDNTASNGVIHFVGGVLIPPKP